MGDRANQDRLGRADEQQLRVVQAHGDLAPKVLFGVAGTDRLHQSAQARHRATRRSGKDARIEGRQVTGQQAAAGAPRAAKTPSVDLRSALQVIEAADRIPDQIRGRVASQEDVADAQQAVPEGWAGQRHSPRIEQLVAFSLVEGIEAERRQAVAREENGDLLVFFVGLAFIGVSAGHQDRWIGRRPVRQVEQGRDVVPRLALVDHLFVTVTVAGVFADRLRVERGPWWKAAQRGQKGLLHSSLVCAELFRGCELLKATIAPVKSCVHPSHQVRSHHPLRRNTIDLLWQHGQFRQGRGQPVDRGQGEANQIVRQRMLLRGLHAEPYDPLAPVAHGLLDRVRITDEMMSDRRQNALHVMVTWEGTEG